MRFLFLGAVGLVATLGLGLANAKEPRVLEPRAQDGDVGIRKCDNDNDHGNNPGLAGPYEIKICYDAFVVNFADRPEAGEPWRIPRFVAYRVAPPRVSQEPSSERPRSWYTVPELAQEGLAATDRSYLFRRHHVDAQLDWYQRGHLAPKMLAERLGADAAKYSHTTANALPQLGRFNRTGWLDLECRTAAWAARAEALWVVTGPAFSAAGPTKWLRAPDQTPPAAPRYAEAERPLAVAIPDLLFKIVVRRDGTRFQALAFLFPQEDPRYAAPLREQHAEDFLVTIARIEELTKLKFFEDLGPGAPDPTAKGRPDKESALWPQRAADFQRGCRNFAKDQS